MFMQTTNLTREMTSLMGRKTLRENQKLLVNRKISFSHNVSISVLIQDCVVKDLIFWFKSSIGETQKSVACISELPSWWFRNTADGVLKTKKHAA